MGDNSYERRGHRFGAARVRSARMSPSSGRRPVGEGPHSYNTDDFNRVAAERARLPSGHYNNSWNDRSSDFDFSSQQSHEDDRASERQYDDRPQQEEVVTNRLPKYASGRLQASGKSVAAPGSSIIHPDDSRDRVLDNQFNPPKKQHSFLDNIINQTRKNTQKNRGVGIRTRGSSLEAGSAPPPNRVGVSIPVQGTSGWVNTRAAPEKSKPRMPLRYTDKRQTIPEKRQRLETTCSSTTSRYSLRNRAPPRLSGLSSFTANSFTIRSTSRPTRLGTRWVSTEGSAAEPIALDSDSDSEPEVQSDSKNTTIIATNGLSDSKQTLSGDEEEKAPAVDLKEIESSSAARIYSCDVMIGLFQCIVNLFFQNDRMCMSNIRGKYEEWSFKSYYLLDYNSIKDVRLYGVSKESETDAEMGSEEPERIEQLLDEASFLVFKCPLPEEADRVAMKTFYDPTDSDNIKAYMMLRPLEDASGDTDLDEIKDILRGHTDIVPIDGKEQAKEYLQNLAKEPFSYRASRRSMRRKNDGEEDGESSSESDDEGSDTDVPVLTYPLPPCTSDIVTIIRHDVSRLKPRRYLNDNIIDYYFKRMILEDYQDKQIVQDKVLFLSSHFYSRLRVGKGSSPTARLEAGYRNVSTWLARSNFFDRSIIFIPINKDLHWSLAIILNPRLAATTGQNDESNDEAFSCIAVLDPLGSYHRKAAIVRNLRVFLRLEWENYKGRLSEEVGSAMPEYETTQVLSVKVKAPQQQNSYDCGVYVLKFAEVILKKCVELNLLEQNEGVISKEVTDAELEPLISPTAFSPEDIATKRKEVREHIEEDSIEYRRLLEQKQQQKAFKASK